MSIVEGKEGVVYLGDKKVGYLKSWSYNKSEFDDWWQDNTKPFTVTAKIKWPTLLKLLFMRKYPRRKITIQELIERDKVVRK